jgi:hypothetical protein
MGDTLSIKEAAQEAVSTFKEAAEETTPEVVDEQVDGTGDEPVEGDTQPEPEEPNTPQADDKPSEEESDFEHIDPKTLPKELQVVYKNLLKGFTKGRQKDSERANKLEKELAEVREKLEPKEVVEAPTKFDTPEEYYSHIAKQTIKEEKVKEYREQASRDYPKLDPRLNDKGEGYDPVFDKAVGSELDSQLAEHIKNTGSEVGFDYKTAFESFKTQWDEYVSGNVKKYISKQNEIAKKNEAKLKKAAPKTTVGQATQSTPLSIRQAMEAAREKLVNK